MEKIILAIDAIYPDKSAVEFACYLGRLTKSPITGIFLENLIANQQPVLKKAYGSVYMDWEVNKESNEYKFKMECVEKSIALFKEICVSRSVSYSLHRDTGVPARELINESRFADVLVVDAETSFNKKHEGTPTEFVKDILKKTECPVIVAPETFDAIDEIVFAYNDTNSLFALKQFMYLFPQLNNKKTSLICVNEAGKWPKDERCKLQEWLKGHYADLHFEAIEGVAHDKLFDHLFKRKNMFLVMGAYGRNALSLFFKQSHADLLIETFTQPIFITHL